MNDLKYRSKILQTIRIVLHSADWMMGELSTSDTDSQTNTK